MRLPELTETELAEIEAIYAYLPEPSELEELIGTGERARVVSRLLREDIPALCRSLRAARRWKREALPLLTRYDNLAETFNGEIGSLKVANLERGVVALRAQLQEEQNRNQIQADSIMDCETEITSLRAQLAQVTQHRDDLLQEISGLTSIRNEYGDRRR